MRQHRFLTLMLASAAALTLTACQSAAGPETPPPDTPAPVETPTPPPATPTPAPAEAPVWGTYTVEQDYFAGDGETLVLRIHCELPHVENPEACPAGAAINAWYEDEGRSRLLEAEDQYELQVADYDISTVTGFQFQPMTQEMTSQVVYEDNGIISIRRELYVDFGGAHPQVYRLSEQFDAATGARLAFADLFSDAEGVMELVTAAFLEHTELKDAGLSREEVAVACQPENFYLSDEGYVFWIQAESLPAVHSPLEVTLSFDALAGLTRHG